MLSGDPLAKQNLRNGVQDATADSFFDTDVMKY